jgi:TPR repeat protein
MGLPVCIISAALLFVCCQPVVAQAGTQKPSLTKDEVAAIRKAAENGDADAQSKLCVMYGPFAEQGVAQDYAQGAVWCRRAADQGRADSQFMLGVAYSLGKGLPQDDTQAVVWYRRAAEQGIAWAQFSLGEMYNKGKGVPQDDTQAAVWLRMAADQGNANAQVALGVFYDQGHGVPQDYAQAAVWYRKAADQGDADAQSNLGILYYLGKGVPQGDAEAVAWLQKAADQGNGDAKEMLPLLREEIAFAASSVSGGTTSNQTRTTLSPQAIAKRASESTVLIVSTDRNRKGVILGSGFAIEANLIVTNSHVFSAGGLGLVGKIGSDQPLPIKQVVLRDRQDDIVLLYVPGLNLPPLPIDPSEPVVGDTVYAMGNPEGMMGTFSEGIVSALRDSKGSHLIQITAPISHGSSGGPVFNVYGQVIGISKSIWASGQNLNFAVPASEIDVLLKRARSIEGDSEEYPEK